ncbi:F-box protein [Peribacillus sp. YIM B13472]
MIRYSTSSLFNISLCCERFRNLFSAPPFH